MSHNQEVMSGMTSLMNAAARKATDTVFELRRQAPAARMIGEFVVKQALKEAEKIGRRLVSNESTTAPHH